MGAVISAVESSRAVDAGEDGVAAAALVLVKLRLLDHVVAGFAVDYREEEGLAIGPVAFLSLDPHKSRRLTTVLLLPVEL